MDFYHIVGYLSGLYFIKPEMDAATLWRTTALIHIVDAVLCRVLAGAGGRRKNLWSAAGLLFGVWALAILFLLPAKTGGGKLPGE